MTAGEEASTSLVATGDGRELLSADTEQAYLTLGIKCPSLSDKQIYEAELLSSSLGELMSSRLFQELREKRGLAYEIGSSIESYPDTGCLLVQGSFEKNRALDALGIISAELEKLSRASIDEAELELAKSHTLSRLSLEQDSLSSNLWRLQEGETVHGRYISAEEDKNNVSRINLDDISAYVETWLKDSSMVVVLGGQVSEIELTDFFQI